MQHLKALAVRLIAAAAVALLSFSLPKGATEKGMVC